MATLKKAVVETKGNVLTWKTQSGAELSINADELSDEIREQALLHGLKQKISDSYSGLKLDYEIDEAVNGVISTLMAGMWNAGRSSTGGIWVEALSRATGEELEVCLEKWNDMDEETRKAVKAHPAVKQAKAEIDLERAKAKAGESKIDLSEIV